MTAFHQALYAFWSQFLYNSKPIPAYLSGKVPNNATFPYITFAVQKGDIFSASVLTAFIWVKAGSGINANQIRASIMDDIARAIPMQGTRINFTGGYATIFRNTSAFMSYYDDPEDASVIGGRISYEVHFYEY